MKSHPWPLSLHVSGAHGSGRPCCRARLPRQALSAGPRRVGPAFRERTDRRGGQTRRRPEGNVAGTGTGGRPRARGAPRKWGAAQAGRLHPQGVIDSPALPSATVPHASEAYACKRLRRRRQDSLSTGLCKASLRKPSRGDEAGQPTAPQQRPTSRPREVLKEGSSCGREGESRWTWRGFQNVRFPERDHVPGRDVVQAETVGAE